MSQTLSNVKLHIVFSTKNRMKYIEEGLVQKRLYAYMHTACHNLGCTLLEVGGTEDHIHLLVNQSKNISICELVRTLKSSSSNAVKSIGTEYMDFAWQEGYGVFSVDESLEGKIRKYICTQKGHHMQRSFEEEFLCLLKRYNVKYDDKELWDDSEELTTSLSSQC
jgi:putative transposase